MRTAAVVVAWREPEVTLEALRSLAAMAPAADHLVCVVQELDDGELRDFRAAAPAGVEVIAWAANLGFCTAANAAVERAVSLGADWVLLVNNDATVTPDCLSRSLAEARSDPDIAVVGPAVAFSAAPEKLWFAGGVHSHRFGFTRHRRLRGSVGAVPGSSDTDYVPGCCALISAAAWRDVGPFREDYFAYYEDAEWASRAKARGWRLRFLGEVLCHHAVGVSSKQTGSLGLSENTAYYLARNPLRFALDTRDVALRASRVLGLMTVWNAYNLTRLVRARRRSVASAYARGLLDAAAGRMGPRPT
ncbi:MAG TPA: glycosyltransferase family 2 protein [Candidatus Dormibacteraeota bacterium]|nr:glycosyltransferase family 2 protein [Candidatus Dormibacteraeota bacterium]